MSSKRLTNEEIQYIKKLYEENMSIKSIAKIINCCPDTVKRWINNDFNRHLSPDYHLEDKIDEIQQLLNKGYTQEYIASKYNCPKTAVYKFIHNHDLKKITLYDKIKVLLDEDYSNKQILDQLNISEQQLSWYKRKVKNERISKFVLKLEDENKKLTEQINLLKKENERLKREYEAMCNLDYETSEIPALKRRIYDLEEICDDTTTTLTMLTASMSSIRYMEYQQEKENL